MHVCVCACGVVCRCILVFRLTCAHVRTNQPPTNQPTNNQQLLSTLHVFILLVFTIYAVFWLFAVELQLFSLETETYVCMFYKVDAVFNRPIPPVNYERTHPPTNQHTTPHHTTPHQLCLRQPGHLHQAAPHLGPLQSHRCRLRLRFRCALLGSICVGGFGVWWVGGYICTHVDVSPYASRAVHRTQTPTNTTYPKSTHPPTLTNPTQPDLYPPPHHYTVEFPRYFKEFMASIGVPVFGVARDGACMRVMSTCVHIWMCL